MDKLVMNASVLIVAGSETTATVLSGVTYLLLDNPDKLAQLHTELRKAFNSDNDITLAKVSRLDYMLACLEETMRLYPPVPIGLPRIVPKGGRIVGGVYLPEGVCFLFPLLYMMYTNNVDRPTSPYGNDLYTETRPTSKTLTASVQSVFWETQDLQATSETCYNRFMWASGIVSADRESTGSASEDD